MRYAANFVAYQLVWLAVVGSAGAGKPALGVAAALVFVAAQMLLSRCRANDVRVLVIALGCGVLVDGALDRWQLVRYAADDGTLPAPLWILALWCAFAMTVNHSLSWLKTRPLSAALLGAAGGPIAYLAAARGFGAVTIAAPSWQGIGALAIGWSAALMLIFVVAGHRPSHTPEGAQA